MILIIYFNPKLILTLTLNLTTPPWQVRMSEAETEADPIVPKLYDSTEEGKKVYRNKAAGTANTIVCPRREVHPPLSLSDNNNTFNPKLILM